MLITANSNNIEHYQETLHERQMDVEVLQTSAGAFEATLESLLLPSLRLTLANVSIQSRFIYHGTFCNENQHIIHFATDAKPLNINGQNISKNSLNIFSPRVDAIVNNNKDTSESSLNVLFTTNMLMQYREGDLIDLLENKNVIKGGNHFNALELERIKIALMKYVVPIVKTPPILTPNVINDIENSIYSYIIELLVKLNAPSPPDRVHSKQQFAVVSRALEYIRECEDVNISVPTLLDYAFCSHRTLQYSFKRVLGITPKRYLTIRRLHLIRNAIVRQPDISIAQLASSYGVVNLGRFSNDFYLLFGIKPMELRKSSL